jgi:hypothetical protein
MGCIRYAKEVLRTMTMDPSPRERAERAQKRWLPFCWEVGSDVFKNVPKSDTLSVSRKEVGSHVSYRPFWAKSMVRVPLLPPKSVLSRHGG